jgi:FMN phosphatase YigB (HAD superfamily)
METQGHHRRVIVLDVGKVLVDFDHRIMLEELARRYGRKIDLSMSLDLDKLFFPVYVDKEPWEGILRDINRALDLSLDFAEWSDLWCRIFTGEVPGMRKALAELKGEFRLVALSNTDEVHWTYVVRRYPIFKLLDGWVVSYEEGIAKPDPRIYQVLVERYCDGRLPVFYTDDSPEYVAAARNLGWAAEVFVDAAGFKEQLIKRCPVALKGLV